MSDAALQRPGDRAEQERGIVEAHVLVGDEVVVLARPWAHGEQSGYTVVKIFAQTSGYADLNELCEQGDLFPEVSSESIAEMLVSGELVQLDCPLPIPAPTLRPHKKQVSTT